MTSRFKYLTLDVAMDEIEKLTDKTEEISEGVQIFSGIHPEWGAVDIVMPLMGDSVAMLPFAPAQSPFAIQQFDV